VHERRFGTEAEGRKGMIHVEEVRIIKLPKQIYLQGRAPGIEPGGYHHQVMKPAPTTPTAVAIYYIQDEIYSNATRSAL
jgi:hypothetical protein